MYIPSNFKNEDIEEVQNFLSKNSFGTLISQTEGKIIATHIPMLLQTNDNGDKVLVGHIAKSNPQSKSFNLQDEVLAIFNGPHSYISSSWYEKKDVPTWNYIAVHIYGKARITEGNELLQSLSSMMDKYEANSDSPVSIQSMSQKTLNQVRGIVGFNIIIDDIQAAYKLSQNRGEPDYSNTIRALNTLGDYNSSKIAEEMNKRRS